MTIHESLQAEFGRIDIYVFDQLLRGRITSDMRILDAGCGDGRNIHYLLRQGARVFGVDRDRAQVERTRTLASELAPELPGSNFRTSDLDALPYPDGFFDCVICSAVLHFAEDETHFEAMVAELWRTLSGGGVFFARLASTIGIEEDIVVRKGRRYALPDGTERFLVDEAYLLRLGSTLGGRLLDPIKTTNVQNQRAMTTWVMEKP